MTILDGLFERFKKHGHESALVWNGRTYSYNELLHLTETSAKKIQEKAILPGTVVALVGNYSPNSIGMLLALMENNCIIVPLTLSVEAKFEEYKEIAQMAWGIFISEKDEVSFQQFSQKVNHPLLLKLKSQQHPGFIFFSSGTTGKSKATVHDVLPLIAKYQESHRKPKSTINFLLFDHMGGINTLLHTLYDGGCVVYLKERKPDEVCKAIQQYRVQILPTSPTFLTVLLLSGIYEKFDLSSLELITYGTEVMPESTLKAFHALFPSITIKQTYGLTEVGVLPTKSKASDSLYIKIGNDECETRVVNGMLEVKTNTAMLGYLNAPSPFTEDGWLKTEDAVEKEGDYYRILGRKSEIINVGGEKVYPAQVEGVIQMMEGVEEVIVTGEPSPITGQIVKARVRLNSQEEIGAFRKRMIGFCKGKLATYQIPQKVELIKESIVSERYKKIRRSDG